MQVTFKDIYKKYGSVVAVSGLNLTIKKGALHFLLGPSGCGKTTTLRMLAGLEEVSSGQLFFDDKDVTLLPAAERGIGMVFQNYALWPHMTVYGNVEYALSLRKYDKKTLKDRVEEALALTQLSQYKERLPGQLSGGQQQRVALARALAIRPNVLLLDEPLSNLDASLRLEMRDKICEIHRQTGITTVYVTHDQKEALSMGTEISVMFGGHLIQSAPPKKLYNRPETPFVAQFIGETNLISGKIIKKDNKFMTISTGFGEIKSIDTSEFREQDQVTLSIRPETIQMIDLNQNHGDFDNLLSLKMSHDIFLGEYEQFILENENGETLKSKIQHGPDHAFKVGDRIQIAIDAKDVLVLKPQSYIGPRT